MDALVGEVVQRWPTIRVITIAGFSAGAQVLQHYISFAAAAVPKRLALRCVIADPGTWLYFDPVRPIAETDGQTIVPSHCVSASCHDQLVQPGNTCTNVNQ